MHPDVVAVWAKNKGQRHLCTLDTCLVQTKIVDIFYAPAIQRMVERAYSYHCPPSISVRVQDGISNLHLSFSGVRNSLLSFSGGGIATRMYF